MTLQAQREEGRAALRNDRSLHTCCETRPNTLSGCKYTPFIEFNTTPAHIQWVVVLQKSTDRCHSHKINIIYSTKNHSGSPLSLLQLHNKL